MAFAKKTEVSITAPDFKVAVFTIRGNAPLVMNKFSARNRDKIEADQKAGSGVAKGRKAKAPKDFERDARESAHIFPDGQTYGIPCAAIRNSLIRACSIVGLAMTKAKLGMFVEADGYDGVDGNPLVKITKGEAKARVDSVRNATGVMDLRSRMAIQPGWEAEVRLSFDTDMLTPTDLANLLMRAGRQVGILAGRPASSMSCGQGWGTFDVLSGDPQ